MPTTPCVAAVICGRELRALVWEPTSGAELALGMLELPPGALPPAIPPLGEDIGPEGAPPLESGSEFKALFWLFPMMACTVIGHGAELPPFNMAWSKTTASSDVVPLLWG